MELATDILLFFHPENIERKEKQLSMGDFLDKNEGIYTAKSVSIAINGLQKNGFLIPTGRNRSGGPRAEFYQTVDYDEDLAQYGTYEFRTYGFPFIRNHFERTVLPIIGKLSDGIPTIGSGFLIHFNLCDCFVTARHNVVSNKEIQIFDFNKKPVNISKIWTTTRKSENLDVCIIGIDNSQFGSIPKFQTEPANLLDEVLTMGYPPIPGFDAIQLAETATVSGTLQSTTGKAVGKDWSYLGRQDLLLISARVKGGNSGGPVINKNGKIIGIVSDAPFENENLDSMGYGIVTPEKTLKDVLLSIKGSLKEIEIEEIHFEKVGEYFEIK
jgi:serine protease Do